MELVRLVLGSVFQVVAQVQVHLVANLEAVVDGEVLDVLGSVVVKLMLVHPVFVFGEQSPMGSFAQAEEVPWLHFRR